VVVGGDGEVSTDPLNFLGFLGPTAKCFGSSPCLLIFSFENQCLVLSEFMLC
jgi:hypothetical protein